MSIFNLDILKLVKNITSPDKRGNTYLAMANAANIGMVRANIRMIYYMGGMPAGTATYDPTATYDIDTMVLSQDAVYISLQANNTGNAVTDADWWELWIPHFIGSDERIWYDGTTLRLTYALNRRFNTTFRQPATIVTGGYAPLSDIYLTNTLPNGQSFLVGLPEQQCSYVNPTSSTGFVGPNLVINETIGFTVNIPTAVFTALGPDTATRTAIVRQFVDGIATAGITYIITTY